MVTVEHFEKGYLLNLTDGYVSREGMRNKPDETTEMASARHMYELINGKRKRKSVREEPEFLDRIPSTVHVWVIGESGWIPGEHRKIQGITEGDSDPSYRILVAGCDIENVIQKRGVYLSNWAAWPFGAGMHCRKKHSDLASFREASKTLLAQLSEAYVRDGLNGSQILDRMGLPYSYYGHP